MWTFEDLTSTQTTEAKDLLSLVGLIPKEKLYLGALQYKLYWGRLKSLNGNNHKIINRSLLSEP